MTKMCETNHISKLLTMFLRKTNNKDLIIKNEMTKKSVKLTIFLSY